ncbi:MAG: N-methylhydantoinase A, partial [uncultured Gemmatimonadaceae bacterium]
MSVNGDLSVGIDVGGTFTDLVAVGEDGSTETRKVLSTPADQSEGVLAALAALGAGPRAVARVVHGTTV